MLTFRPSIALKIDVLQTSVVGDDDGCLRATFYSEVLSEPSVNASGIVGKIHLVTEGL